MAPTFSLQGKTDNSEPETSDTNFEDVLTDLFIFVTASAAPEHIRGHMSWNLALVSQQ